VDVKPIRFNGGLGAASNAPLGHRTVLRKRTIGVSSQPDQLWFEVLWKRSEAGGPPMDLLEAVEKSFPLLAAEEALFSSDILQHYAPS